MSDVDLETDGTLVRGKPVRPALVLVALLVAVASFQLNATMLSPAIGSMAEELGTTPSTIGLSSTVFSFVTAIAGLFWPPLSDIIGRRRALLISTSIMTVGSLVAVLAVNVPMLMLGRALQGACGATFSLAFLMLRGFLTPQKFGKYIGIITAVNAGVGGIDTLVGGLIADSVGFRGIFALTLVLEVIAVVLMALWAPESKASGRSKMDWAGIALLTIFLLGVNYGLTVAFTAGGFAKPMTWISFVVAGAAIVCFYLAERSASSPLLPPSAMKDRGVWGTLFTTFFTLASSFAVLVFLVPVLATDAKNGFGLDATRSALMFLVPYSVLGWATAPVVGNLAPKVGYRLMLRIGLAGSVALTAGMALGFRNQVGLAVLVFLMGLTYAALAATTLNGMGVIFSPKDNPGTLPGLNSTMFNFGASVGIGVLSSILASGAADGGYGTAFIVAAVFAGLALVSSMLLPTREVEGEKV